MLTAIVLIILLFIFPAAVIIGCIGFLIGGGVGAAIGAFIGMWWQVASY